MDAIDQETQRIDRLTPLATVLARLAELVGPVPSRRLEAARAAGRVLAADVVVDAARPGSALAWQDGWAVTADLTLDAGSYTPAPLPGAAPVEVGDPMPAGTDAVAPPEAVRLSAAGVEALAPLAPGDGPLAPGADATAGERVATAGARLRASDTAALRGLGLDTVLVREPRLAIVPARAGDRVAEAIAVWLCTAAAGCDVRTTGALEHADGLPGADTADAVVIVGGSGTGRRDRSVTALARAGRVAVHGIGVRPGETAAFGLTADDRPVLVLPGRTDGAIAVWLTLGAELIARLAGLRRDAPGTPARLSRKIASTVGLAEFVPVRRTGAMVEPLAGGHVPLAALAQADGWILVAAESEGFPAGADVEVRPLP